MNSRILKLREWRNGDLGRVRYKGNVLEWGYVWENFERLSFLGRGKSGRKIWEEEGRVRFLGFCKFGWRVRFNFF